MLADKPRVREKNTSLSQVVINVQTLSIRALVKHHLFTGE